MKSILTEKAIIEHTEFAREIEELKLSYEEWVPRGKLLKELSFRLEPLARAKL